ncbi:hypothetical protein [Thalassoglobus polymorphus]|uniref:Uncharacterized protein n=1 Tax=Thalassoglobus polymorphus TaxID=2527994 RepID=A0A517QPZ8_9PLAN|nr:hypothetical protein [Thalassoglobus polymorphus]QDT33701.1 hypothetical protein Mal48_29550 [Thalassoglobus polymorphus]
MFDAKTERILLWVCVAVLFVWNAFQGVPETPSGVIVARELRIIDNIGVERVRLGSSKEMELGTEPQLVINDASGEEVISASSGFAGGGRLTIRSAEGEIYNVMPLPSR